MRYVAGFTSVCILLLLGCEKAQSPVLTFHPNSTIKEIMDSIVDPNADFIWESVSSIETAKGWEKKYPRNDEEWKEVRRHAVSLIEASNLLLIPGRNVAHPGEKADNPSIEEGPEEIQALISHDRNGWQTKLNGLYKAATAVLIAIDNKKPEGVLETSEKLDQACENCHLDYWYPRDKEGVK